jgi:hypothetical protein
MSDCFARFLGQFCHELIILIQCVGEYENDTLGRRRDYFAVRADARRSGEAAKVSAAEEYKYSLSDDRSPETKDKSSYTSLGDVIFRRVQNYKLVAKTDAARKPHFLSMSLTKPLERRLSTGIRSC